MQSLIPSAADRSSTLTEWVNGRTGTVRASGVLTAQGADLLRGTLENLARQGHRTVVLDLADVRVADGTGTPVMRDLQAGVAACGGRLRLVRAPAWAR
jgi:anti-anti-sigma regulatory factor